MRRFAVASLVVLAACGTLDAPPTDHLVDPGKGPFREQGAVETCLGGARVVAPSSGASGLVGLCVPAQSQAKGCESDASCGRDEACVCGRCMVQGCNSVGACGGNGRLCVGGRCAQQCNQNADCASDETCTSGACSRSCGSDADCGYGGACDPLDKTCQARVCQKDEQCGDGMICSLQEQIAEVREPAWARLRSGDVLLVELRASTDARAIFRAKAITKARVVLADTPVAGDLAGTNGIGAPAPLVKDGRLVALYAEQGGAIVVLPATSADDVVVGAPSPVLEPSEAWESGRIASPAIATFLGGDRLFYEFGQADGVGMTTLDASGKPGPRRIVAAPNVFEDPVLWHHVTHVGAPEAVVSGDTLLLYATANGIDGSSAFQGSQELPAPNHDAIGLLATTDLDRFQRDPEGPVFTRRYNFRTYLAAREPAVRLFDAGAEMIVVAGDAGDPAVRLAGLAIAESP